MTYPSGHPAAFDLHKHLAEGGTVSHSWDPGTPDTVIDRRFDAVLPGDPPGYLATARDSSGKDVAIGASRFDSPEEPSPAQALERLRYLATTPIPPTDPDCPF